MTIQKNMQERKFKIKAEYAPAGDPGTTTFLKEKVGYGARSGNII